MRHTVLYKHSYTHYIHTRAFLLYNSPAESYNDTGDYERKKYVVSLAQFQIKYCYWSVLFKHSHTHQGVFYYNSPAWYYNDTGFYEIKVIVLLLHLGFMQEKPGPCNLTCVQMINCKVRCIQKPSRALLFALLLRPNFWQCLIWSASYTTIKSSWPGKFAKSYSC